MTCAGVLLTGGGSRRMGRDKASLPAADAGPAGHAETLATRTARLLLAVCPTSVEVGPGHTNLPTVLETPPGGGPLRALVTGWEALAADGWTGPVLAVATDLPRLTVPMLQWLCQFPGSRSVVPVADGRVQPLCARYAPWDLRQAAFLVGRGETAMKCLLEAIDAVHAHEESWLPSAADAMALRDVDTPEELRRVTGP